MRKEEKQDYEERKSLPLLCLNLLQKAIKVLSSMNFVKWMVLPKEFCIIIFQGNQTSI